MSLKSVASWITIRTPLRYARWFVRAAQLMLFMAAAISAFLLRFEFSIPPSNVGQLYAAILIWPLVKSIAFATFGLDRGWWRFVSTYDVVRISAANITGSIAGGLLLVALGPPGFPRSLYILDFILSLGATAGFRLAVRLLSELAARESGSILDRTFIYGAGTAGMMLLREIRSNPGLGYNVCGFIDDDPHKQGLIIHGLPVLGRGSSLTGLAVQDKVRRVLIATPSATGPQMTRILGQCQEAGIEFRTIPALSAIIEGRGLAQQIREVDVEDLLGRSPVKLDEQRIRATLQGEPVLVTGAGGSIGSELCRQIARFAPSAIIGFDASESALFHLDQEMRARFPGTPFHPEIGCIRDRDRVNEVFARYNPAQVYHAAAYKHVPLMEKHAFEAVSNNIFGTYNLAEAAAWHGVAKFVMISSDKAVRPTSLMGATKRVAELVVAAMQRGSTKYVSVRFGNVLGSNGSVIPIFKKQIASGGPVTVTHPDMRRFFMTIPEAVQLVLQAGAMGGGGETFILDMGDPVKIVDLARNLILLSGLRPDHDIRIEFTGKRPGEKHFEELTSGDEVTSETSHEKIRIYKGESLRPEVIEAHLAALREHCATRDLGRLILQVKRLVPDYNPSESILKDMLRPLRITEPGDDQHGKSVARVGLVSAKC